MGRPPFAANLMECEECQMCNNETVLVSACLLGVNCKWDASNAACKKVLELAKTKRCIPICPEQLGGLATPRESAERTADRIITKSGVDVTAAYAKGAMETVKLAQLYGCMSAIMKQRSPSCGCGKVYDGAFSGKLIAGDGMTVDELKKLGIEVISDEEL